VLGFHLESTRLGPDIVDPEEPTALAPTPIASRL